MRSDRSGRGNRALPGAAALALVDGVVHLDPERAVFDAMVEGWATQMLSRGLKAETIESPVWLVRRFGEFTNDYPWSWRPVDVEDFTARRRWRSSSRRSARRSGSLSTQRCG